MNDWGITITVWFEISIICIVTDENDVERWCEHGASVFVHKFRGMGLLEGMVVWSLRGSH